MAFAKIVSVSAGSVDSGDITTSSVDTTGANLLVAAVSYLSFSALTPIADSKSNTWTPLTNQQTNGKSVRLFYVYNPTVGTGHTFTGGNGTSLFPSISVIALSGSASSPFDQENGNTTIGSATISTGSVTPGQDNEILVAAVGSDLVLSSIDSGFTLDENPSGPQGLTCGLAHLIETTATAQNPTFTHTASSGSAAAAIATFKAAAATDTGLWLIKG